MKKIAFVGLAVLIFALASCGTTSYGRKCDGRKATKTRMGNM